MLPCIAWTMDINKHIGLYSLYNKQARAIHSNQPQVWFSLVFCIDFRPFAGNVAAAGHTNTQLNSQIGFLKLY